MAIEIKELHIKIKVDEEKPTQVFPSTPTNPLKNEVIMAEIIRKCTRNVLKILKEKRER